MTAKNDIMNFLDFKLLILFLTPLFSCSSKENLENNQWTKMMVIHDEVMPKTSEIVLLAEELEDFPLSSPSDSLLVKNAITALNDSEESMFEWMSNLKQLKTLRKNLTHQQIMDYLHQETLNIIEVQQKMESSLENGQQLFNELKRNQ
jgi:hypothetical protein